MNLGGAIEYVTENTKKNHIFSVMFGANIHNSIRLICYSYNKV